MTKPDAAPIAELETLFPESKTITVDGKEITIRPPTVSQLVPIGQALGRITGDDGKASDIEMLALLRADDVRELVAMATGESAEWIGGLRADRGLELAIAVWEVWAPFFAKRMIPLLKNAVIRASLSVG